MKMGKRAIAAGAAAVMLTNLAFTGGEAKTVKAEETVLKQVELDASVLVPDDGTWDAQNDHKIYFGQYNNSPMAFRVLQADDTAMLLDSDKVLESKAFDEDGQANEGQTSGYTNEWSGSDIEKWLNGDEYYSNPAVFETEEKEAIKSTVLEKTDEYYVGTVLFWDYQATDYIFLLSASEMSTLYAYDEGAGKKTDMNGQESHWFIRSSSRYKNTYDNGVVNYISGKCEDFTVTPDVSMGIAPAFNLDLSAVSLVSGVVAGKPDAGSGTLSKISDYTGNEWKLTLLEDSRRFSANTNGQTSASVEPGGSIRISYTGAQTGTNEYVSVLLCDSNDNVLYYGNIDQNSASGTATLSIPSDLALGNYTLKVFSEQRNGDYKTDYASDFQNIELQVTFPPEATPNASFTAASDNSGTLSKVDTSMKYSVDGGNTWNAVTGATMELNGVTADNDVKIYKPGNGTTTSDSEIQTIDVTQAAQPTGLGKVDCTTLEQNNGQITGVSSTMEYMVSTASEWTAITGNTVTGLANGTYYVRVKANGTVLASAPANITIGKHTCVAQGDWQYDGDKHWKLCACGAKVDEAVHSGGIATCIASPVCEVCSQPYGEKNPSNHTGNEAWITTDTTHTKVYSCCQTVIEGAAAHTWENGKCTVCQYDCRHEGGTATCSQLAQCELCGSLYGDYDTDNHKASATWTQENSRHYHICEYGCDTHLDEAYCSGGEATCIAPAVCEICGGQYGETNSSNHTNLVKTEEKPATHLEEGNEEYWYCDGCDNYFSDEAGTQKINLADTVIPKLTEHTADGTGWHWDENSHWHTCECGEIIDKTVHTFEWVTDKEATSTEAGKRHEECTVCGYAKAAEEIPVTGTTTNPKDPSQTVDKTSASEEKTKGTASPETGDSSSILLWGVILLAAGSVLSGTVLYNRKRKNNR